MKKIFILFLLTTFFIQCKPTEPVKQEETITKPKKETVQIYTKPKLVVGIVVDQMRYDYLTRFWERYGDKGFKRLISDGYLCKNNHYNYVPTYTAPGHTSIYTGTTPRINGIISNQWYDKKTDHYIYCASDDSVSSIGTTSDAGKMSPKRLLTTTVSDENRLATQFRGKTIGIALKDRAAILPAGHTANAAYWFHGKDEGRFISSSYYMEKLPDWVKNFNTSGKAESYLKTWETLYPISTYTESGKDLNDFERGFKGKKTATFPYDLKKLSQENGGFSILKSVPYGDDLTTDFALAAMEGENLGQGTITDFLTISYSSPDYIGHNFGVNSKEVEDNYLRLDKDIGRLLDSLDNKVGKGNYTVFLTADHGGVNVPAYLKSKKIPAGYFSTSEMRKKLKSFVGETYGTVDLIANISNSQVFFNYEALKTRHIKPEDLENTLKHFLITYKGISQVYTRTMIENSSYTGIISSRVRNGFNSKRSGDVAYVLEPSVVSYSHTGSTHGSPYNYDTHVPLIFYGKGINNGQTTELTETVDIAPTISALLGIAFPNGATGKVLSEVIDVE